MSPPDGLPPVIWSSAWSSADPELSSPGCVPLCFFLFLPEAARGGRDVLVAGTVSHSGPARRAPRGGDQRGHRGKRAQRAYRVNRVTSQTLSRRRLGVRRPGVQLLSSGHLVTVAVALGTVATTLPNGAYSRPGAGGPRRGGLVGGGGSECCCGCSRARRCRGRPSLAGGCLIALTGFTALSMGWGVDDGGAFDDTMRAVCYAGVFALVVVASPARSARSWLAGTGDRARGAERRGARQPDGAVALPGPGPCPPSWPRPAGG